MAIVKDNWECTKCCKVHDFGLWYAAHAFMSLNHTCSCGAIHDIEEYVVTFRQMKSQAAK